MDDDFGQFLAQEKGICVKEEVVEQVERRLTPFDIERLECTHRVEVELQGLEFYHEFIFPEVKKLNPLLDYDFAFLREREKLLQRYDGLLTRGFLREERWLEFTLIQMENLLKEETTKRASVEAEEAGEACALTVRRLRLDGIALQGTQGTVVEVEEQERVFRHLVLIFEEIQAREDLEEQAEISQEVATVKEAQRRDAYRQLQIDLRDTEIPARWDIEAEEIPARRAIEHAKAEADRHLFGLLQWRIIVRECDLRYEIEREEQEAVEAVQGMDTETLRATVQVLEEQEKARKQSNAQRQSTANNPEEGSSGGSHEQQQGISPEAWNLMYLTLVSLEVEQRGALHKAEESDRTHLMQLAVDNVRRCHNIEEVRRAEEYKRKLAEFEYPADAPSDDDIHKKWKALELLLSKT